MNPVARKMREALERRRGSLPAQTRAFRWVNATADGLPDVTVDGFEDVAVLSLFRAFDPAEEAALGDALVEAGAQSVYLKRRPREARHAANVAADWHAPVAPFRGPPVESVVVSEDGLRFLIRPANGLSVGLYLDARQARAWVRREAQGSTVLNGFAYTCGFGVAALAGGAVRAVNLDLSKKVLEWGRENAALNALPAQGAEYLAGDAFERLPRLAKRGERFDLVVLDPPSFSTTRTGRFSAATDTPRLVAAAAGVLLPGGRLLACCNQRSLSAEKHQALVQRGLDQAGRVGRRIAQMGAPPEDFPASPDAPERLKVVVYEVR